MTKEDLEKLYMDIYDNGISDNNYKEKFKRYVNNRLENLEKEKCELLGIIQGKDKVIKDLEWQLQEVAKDNDNYQAENKQLEKENAELKEQNANLIIMLKSEREVRVNDDYLKGICELEGKVQDWTSEYCELENLMNNKLANAKEIVKHLLPSCRNYPDNNLEWIKNAEEFSKECQ